MSEIDTVVRLLMRPEDYDLGMDLMWEAGLDYDEVMEAFGRATAIHPYGYATHRKWVQLEYYKWAGVIHAERQ